jgi:hypothetical protein
MQRRRFRILSALLSALALGAAASAGAQTVVVQQATPDAIQATPDTIQTAPYTTQAAPDTLPPSDSQTLVVVPPTPTPVPDSNADAKCRMVLPQDYWDCVNSHNGGG